MRVEFAHVDRGRVDAIELEQALDHAAGLRTLEGHRHFLAFVHLGPGHGERHRLTGAERDETVRGRFDVGDALRHVRDAPRPLEALIGDVIVVRAGKHVGRFRIAHEVEAQVDHVQQVDQRPAPGERLVGEPAAESRNAGAPNPLRLAGVDRADDALLDLLHHGVALRPGAVVEVEHQRAFGRLGGGLHRHRLLGVQRGRLFAEHVLAGLQGLQGERRVKLVRDDDRDSVQIRHAQELGDVRIDLADAVLRRGLFRRGLVDVGQGDDFRTGLAEARGVIGGHAAGANDRDLDAHGEEVAIRLRRV